MDRHCLDMLDPADCGPAFASGVFWTASRAFVFDPTIADTADIANAFYIMILPDHMRKYFILQYPLCWPDT